MNRLLHCVIGLLISSTALADSGGHPVTMWMAEGATNRVYLLGSVHLLRKQDHPLPGVIDTAYDDAESLFMELDMDDLDPVYTQSAFNKAGVMTDGRTLKQLIGEDSYAQAEAAAEGLAQARVTEANAIAEEKTRSFSSP